MKSAPTTAIGRVAQNRLLSQLPLIGVAAAILGMVTVADAAEEFIHGPRSTVGVVKLGETKQIVQWVGPDAPQVQLPHVSKEVRTFLVCHVVPGGMHCFRGIDEQVNVTGLMAYGTGMQEGDLKYIADRWPHLKNLMLKSYANVSQEELSDLSEAERSRLNSEAISEADLQQLSRFDDLAALEISGFDLPAGALEILSEMRGLTTLILRDTRISDEDLRALSRLSQLAQLNLTGTPVTGAGLRHLRDCSQLRIVMLERTRVDDSFHEVFREHPWEKLAALTVSKCPITETGLDALRDAAPFTEIVTEPIDCDDVVPATLRDPHAIRQYRTAYAILRYLAYALVETRNSSADVMDIVADSNPQCDPLMAEVAFVEGLRFLRVDGCNVTGDGIRKLHKHGRLQTLEGLFLKATKVDDQTMAEVARFENLRLLDLSETQVGDSGIATLSKLPAIADLRLSGTSVTDKSLKLISEFPNLNAISLNGCDVSDAGVRHLLDAKKLEGFDLQNTRVSEELAKRIYLHAEAVKAEGR